MWNGRLLVDAQKPRSGAPFYELHWGQADSKLSVWGHGSLRSHLTLTA